MRKIVAVSLLFSFFTAMIVFAGAQETRPRRASQRPNSAQRPSRQPVADSSPLPPSEIETPSSSNSKRPPKLIGAPTKGNDPPRPQQQAETNSNSEQKDVQEVGEDDIVRINTTLVTVPVSVMDRNGKYIPDLRREDFRIYEDGVEQEVAYFVSVEKPFTVALVIDTSNSTKFRLEDIQDAAITFVDQLRPDDKVMVMSFDDRIQVLADATTDRPTLRNAIRRTRTGGGTRLYDAMDLLMNERLSRISGRKAIVLFTDGVDTTSRRATLASNLSDAEELDALIYPVQYDTYQDVRRNDDDNNQRWPAPRGPRINIPWPFPSRIPGSRWPWPLTDLVPGIFQAVPPGAQPQQRGSSREEYERADQYLQDLAQKTGARLHRTDNLRDVTEAFALIAEELRRQYSLGYYPKTIADGTTRYRRRIKVSVRQPNLIVRARDSYIDISPASDVANGENQDRTERSKPDLRKRPLTY